MALKKTAMSPLGQLCISTGPQNHSHGCTLWVLDTNINVQNGPETVSHTSISYIGLLLSRVVSYGGGNLSWQWVKAEYKWTGHQSRPDIYRNKQPQPSHTYRSNLMCMFWDCEWKFHQKKRSVVKVYGCLHLPSNAQTSATGPSTSERFSVKHLKLGGQLLVLNYWKKFGWLSCTFNHRSTL